MESPEEAGVKLTIGDAIKPFQSDQDGKTPIPRRAVFPVNRTGLKPNFEKTFGIIADMMADQRHELELDPPASSNGVLEEWADRVRGMRPSCNGERVGSIEAKDRERRMSFYHPPGPPLPWVEQSSPTPEILAHDTAMSGDVAGIRLQEMTRSFEKSGSFNMAGVFEPTTSTPHGSCMWLKLHYGMLPLSTTCDITSLTDS